MPISCAHRTSSPRGFTFVELLVVLVILGIMAALVVPQIARSDSFAAQGAARMLVSDLLFAQNNAIAEQAEREVRFDIDAQNYWIEDETDTPLPAAWLGGQYRVQLGDNSKFPGVRIDAANFGGATDIAFDELGTPSSGGTVDLTVGGVRFRITVTAFTGRVTVDQITGGN
jgi:prepilin-type N-terminal cleavage/methylation domain-containing protein